MSAPLPTTVAAKPYDWTYATTSDPGHHTHLGEPPDSEICMDADPDDPAHTIPLSELTIRGYFSLLCLVHRSLYDN